jgi:mono/diheme cytochrome c family protein
MKPDWRVAVLGLVAAFVAVNLCAQSSAEAGKPLYERRCALCHGPDGAPAANVAKMLMADIPNLGSAKVQSKSAAEIQRIVKEGSGKMKAIKGIADADIANIIAYIRTFKKP